MANRPNSSDIDAPTPILLMVRELGIGGCESDLTKIARAIDRRRFSPHVGCLHPNGIRRGELDAVGVPIVHLPVTSLASRSWISGARLLGKYIRTHGIRLVHTFDAAMDMVAVPIAGLFRVPVIIKSHLGYRDAYVQKSRGLFSVTDRLTTAFVVNSRAVQQDLVAHGVSVRRTHLCYNGVDTTAFHPGQEIAIPSPDRPLVIGTVCALRSEKRLDWLLEAFAQVRKRVPNVRLVVVGSGPMREQLEGQRKRLAIEDASQFEPATSEVAHWMRQMDVFVLTSETESFPNALLEAMACGRCVVASNVGGVPEMVSDGENGLVFEVGNVAELALKLARVLESEDLRNTYASNARRTARDRFSIERNVACIEQLYASLLNASPRLSRSA